MSSKWEVKEEYRALFIEESQNQIEEWEQSLLILEKNMEDCEQIDRLFRAVHTLKGSAGFVGFEELQQLVHGLESALQDIRDGNSPLTQQVTDILFEGLDLSRRFIDAFAANDRSGADSGDFAEKLESLAAQLGGGVAEEPNPFEETEESRPEPASGKKSKKKKKTQKGGEAEGKKSEVSAEQVPGTAAEEQVPGTAAEQQQPEAAAGQEEVAEKTGEDETGSNETGDTGASSSQDEDLLGTGSSYRVGIHIQTTGQEAYLKGLLIQHKLEEIGKVILVTPALEELKLGRDEFKYEVVVETSADEEKLRKTVDLDLVYVGEIHEMTDETGAADDQGEQASGPGADADQSANQGAENQGAESQGSRLSRTEEVVRVPVEKLDVMLNLVGELVVHNSGFISTTDQIRETYGRGTLVIDLEEKTEGLSKIARDLQDAVMKVRMLPVAAVFNRFQRVVRDLAKDRDKKVELIIYGEETEIDKKVMDRIGEPLVHLVRNAVDHGLESDEDRSRAGKDPVGRIRLGAFQEGDHICIEVSDDGRGLNREKILKKAISKGLVKQQEAEAMNDQEVYRLIFQAGFSTADKVTDISGRGVGLDVVKSTVEDMGGDVWVRSQMGAGTSITITLPLTMAIIPAILVGASDSLFAIPLSSVREVVKPRGEELQSVQGSATLHLRDEVISVADLNKVLGLKANGSNGNGHREIGSEENGSEENGHESNVHGGNGQGRPIVIVDYAGAKVGVMVERLLGNEEVVIKSLSRHYREIEGLVGASILGNGKIALILDVEGMVRRHCKEGDLLGRKGDISFSGSRSSSVEQDTAGGQQTGTAVNVEAEEAEQAGVSGQATTAVQTMETAGPAPEIAEGTGGTEPAATGSGGPETREETAAPESAEPGTSAPVSAQPRASLIDLDLDQKALLEDIHAAGAVSASMSMSLFMQQDVRVSFPETKIVKLTQVGDLLGGDELPVGGIFVPLHGDINGAMLMVLPVEQLLHFSDMIMRKEQGTTTEVNEQEASCLMEMGNILTASFINSMADETNLDISLDVPDMRVDMCLSIIDNVLAGFNQPGDQVVLTEAELYFSDEEQAVCFMLLFLDAESMKVLNRTLADPGAGKDDGKDSSTGPDSGAANTSAANSDSSQDSAA
jgi:chemotaxis protein histidine kinase CheA/chemotaxis protein CheY-P-specific phosphatase CheC